MTNPEMSFSPGEDQNRGDSLDSDIVVVVDGVVDTTVRPMRESLRKRLRPQPPPQPPEPQPDTSSS